MSTSCQSPTSVKILTRSNTTTSTSTLQLQLRRSISVENEKPATAFSFLSSLGKSCNQETVVKESTNKSSNSLSTEKDFANLSNVNQQQLEAVTLSNFSTTVTPGNATLTTIINNISNSNSLSKSSVVSQNLLHLIPSDILDDLASRFIINTPFHERQNLIRICFQIELAHWFYLDFFCGNEEKKIIPCGLKQFALHLFQHIPFLRNFLSDIDKILEDWKQYKLSVPTYGAILVSEDLKNVLLVQSYWAKSSWGFPKGKINEHEDPVHCATREVYEETGFDITDLIKPDHFIECVINYQYTRLYIIRNVSTHTMFSPRTRKEIKCCEWFPLDTLPINKNDPNCKSQLGINSNSFFMIIPFMKRLKKWINDNRSGIERKYSSSSPITTFNNNNGCGNYYGNNSSGNYNYNSSNSSTSNSNGLVKQHSSAKKINNVEIKKNGTCTSNINNSTNSNPLKGGTINSNNNLNNNNQKNKRQRHKSMGDIDGIKLKLNFIKNNNSNRSQQQPKSPNGQDKINNSTTQSNCNSKDSNEVKKCFFEDNLKYAIVKHVSSKRQLFSCISTDGSTSYNEKSANNNNINNNNNVNNINMNKKEKDKDKIIQSIIINNTNNSSKNGGNNINNTNVRSRTKSLGQTNNKANTDNIVNSNDLNNNNNNNSNKNNTNKNIINKNINDTDKTINNNSNNNNDTVNKDNKNDKVQSKTNSNGVQRKNSNEKKDGSNMRKNSHNLQQQLQHHQETQQILQNQQNEIEKNGQNQIKQIIIKKNVEKSINHHNFFINNCTNQQRQFLKLKQQHEEFKAEQEKNEIISSQHIVVDNIKFNPNFDSWTNFSFTKNFIANVFC